MVHLHRLIIAALVALFVVPAIAAFTQGDKWRPDYGTGYYSTAAAACAVAVSYLNTNSPNLQRSLTGQITYVGSRADCAMKWPMGPGRPDGTGAVSAYLEGKMCPANSTTLSGGKCECSSGFFERQVNGATACVKPDDRTPEQLCEDAAVLYNSTLQGSRFQRVKAYLREYAYGGLTCADVNGMPSGTGCKHWFTGDLGFKDDEGQDWTNGTSIALNKGDPRAGGSLVCGSGDGDAQPEEKPPPDDCKNGYKGQVNGVDVCIEAWTGDTESNDWNRNTDGEGNHTDENTNVKCKGDQCTVTQTKTTTKQDGTTTTTTTTTENVNRQGYCARNPESAICRREDDPSGGDKGPATRPGGGKGGGDGPDGEGFCKENPESPICKKSNFGGSCAASFTCEGDAIQCAIAKEQHLRACKLFDDKSPESDLYEAEKAKDRNRDVTKDLPGNEEIDVSTRLSRANVLGASSCIGDLSVTVWRTQVTLPLSRICAALAQLGWILVAVSSIAAARIVTKT